MATNIVVPELGESVVEARVAKWLKQQGDTVSAGEPLVELETEKIDLEVSADRAGVLANIKHQEGADVKVGEVLAVLEESTNGAGKASASAPVPPPAAKEPAAKPADKKATPTAKNVAKAYDVKLESVEPAGARVTKQDVLRAAAPAAAPAPVSSKPQAPGAPQAPHGRVAGRVPALPQEIRHHSL